MPLRMSVRPTASHTRTPLGTGIIVAPAPRPPPPPKPATPKPGSAYGRCPRMRSRSPAQAARRRHHQPTPPEPERSHSPRPEDLAASGRSNSASRRPDAPRLALPHRTRMPPLQSPASARRSTGDAARDQPIPRHLPSHRLLHRCKHRCLHHCAITPHQTARRKAACAGGVRGSRQLDLASGFVEHEALIGDSHPMAAEMEKASDLEHREENPIASDDDVLDCADLFVLIVHDAATDQLARAITIGNSMDVDNHELDTL